MSLLCDIVLYTTSLPYTELRVSCRSMSLGKRRAPGCHIRYHQFLRGRTFHKKPPMHEYARVAIIQAPNTLHPICIRPALGRQIAMFRQQPRHGAHGRN